jgi:hypothetical protein
MNAHCHCTSVLERRTQVPTLARQSLHQAGWLVPSLILAFLPKCPACLTAYVALGTGVSLSFSTASYIKSLLMTLCVASLLYYAAQRFRRLIPLMFTPKGTGQ